MKNKLGIIIMFNDANFYSRQDYFDGIHMLWLRLQRKYYYETMIIVPEETAFYRT